MGHLATALAFEGVTVILDEEASNLEFSGRFRNTPIEQILQAMAERTGDGGVVAQRDGYVYVGRPTDGDYDVAVYPVASGPASDWIELYKLAGSDRARAEGFGDLIVVRDTSENLERVGRFHEAISGVRRQYRVEVVVAELTEAQSRSIGIDWNLSGDQVINWTAGINPNTADLVGSFEASLQGLLFGESSETRGSSWDSVILHVVEGEEASITSGDEVNIRKRAVSDSGTVTDIDTQSFQTGFQLSVQVHGVEAGLTRLDIEPEISAVTEYQDGVPTISTRSISSQVYLGSGGVAVLGGLRNRQSQQGGPRVPGTTWKSGVDEREQSLRFFVFCRLLELEDEYWPDDELEEDQDDPADLDEDDELEDHQVDPADEDPADFDDDDDLIDDDDNDEHW